MDEKPEFEEVFKLLGDQYAREILKTTRNTPMDAETISEKTGMSLTTVYRRTEKLVNNGFLIERTEIGPEGHHYTTYETTFDSIIIGLENEDFEIDVKYKVDIADKFTKVWEELRKI